MKRVACALIGGVFFFAPALEAQNEWEQQVRERLEGPARMLQDSGFSAVQDVRIGSLRMQQRDDVRFDLRAGVQYLLIAACDNDCTDLNMALQDRSGQVISQDVEKDALPIVVHMPDDAEAFTAVVEMIACSNEPCYYGVALYARGTGAGAVAAAAPRQERGELQSGDRQLTSGEYFDEYTFQGSAGEPVTIELRSSDFDTYLIVKPPDDGEQLDNDDASEGETNRSLLSIPRMERGEYRILVTSYQKGETGAYQLSIAMGAVEAGGKDQVAAAGPRVEMGRLEEGDQTLDDGEYIDVHRFEGQRGQQVVLDLRSRDFDPYLIFRGPDEQSVDNDDHEGDRTRSLIVHTLEADGNYRVGVTSYQAGETGAYELRINLGGSGGPAVAAGPMRESGSLRAGDDTLRSGEFVDVYHFEGTPGQHASIQLTSSDFDTYLIMIDPAGEQEENDDDGSTERSRVEHDLTEPGQYRILVTSYAPGETGDYALEVDLGTARGEPAQRPQQRDVTTIAMGGTQTGRLEPGDGQLDDGEYRDIYVFNGQAGQAVVVDMESQEFDTYLALLTPNNEDVQNDDFESSTRHSRIEMTLRESGRYRIVATSYGAEETGAYEIRLSGGGAAPSGAVAANRPAQPVAPAAGTGGGRVFGIFAGISDYAGRASNLPYTADDAVRVRNALIAGAGMDPNNGILLTDAQATTGGVRSAMQQLSSRMGPDDTFVFFYSGHGGRQPRPGGDYQVTDPDGMDETIELVDAGVTDDQFNAWMDELNVGRVLLWLDACFSGGFSKDVISRPGRMGMFSSEEDVTSSVAAKFRAGGYLAVFLADAIQDQLADADRDGQISAIELSQYVHERYRADLKSADPGEFVRTGGPQLGFQHLVVDRGSIGPYDILFR